MSEGKLVIFSAPSGAGKTTIVRHLLSLNLNFEFSVSATTRKPRGSERHGKDYYFLSGEEFKKKKDRDEFLEWEEVYPGCFYGTLKSEVERIFKAHRNIIFDIDVVGGSNIKKYYGEKALAVFVQAPSLTALKDRLMCRSTESPDKIKERIAKAEQEMSYASLFDVVIINDKLEAAFLEAEEKVRQFLGEGFH